MLCIHALPWVEKRASHRGHTLRVIDVNTDPALRDVYGERVPVVFRDGVEVLSGRFTHWEVRRALR